MLSVRPVSPRPRSGCSATDARSRRVHRSSPRAPSSHSVATTISAVKHAAEDLHEQSLPLEPVHDLVVALLGVGQQPPRPVEFGGQDAEPDEHDGPAGTGVRDRDDAERRRRPSRPPRRRCGSRTRSWAAHEAGRANAPTGAWSPTISIGVGVGVVVAVTAVPGSASRTAPRHRRAACHRRRAAPPRRSCDPRIGRPVRRPEGPCRSARSGGS